MYMVTSKLIQALFPIRSFPTPKTLFEKKKKQSSFVDLMANEMLQTFQFIPIQICGHKFFSNLKETKRSDQLLSLLCLSAHANW